MMPLSRTRSPTLIRQRCLQAGGIQIDPFLIPPHWDTKSTFTINSMASMKGKIKMNEKDGQ